MCVKVMYFFSVIQICASCGLDKGQQSEPPAFAGIAHHAARAAGFAHHAGGMSHKEAQRVSWGIKGKRGCAGWRSPAGVCRGMGISV